MRFDNEVIPYLTGEKFHNGIEANFLLTDDSGLADRNFLLAKISKGKKIIHFGCADHLPLIDTKIKHGLWLHKILTDNSELCVGLDINKDAIEYIVAEKGFNNVYLCDIFQDELPREISENHFDSIILGEIIEHVDNPVLFLKRLKERLGGKVDNIVITCPNAFGYANFIYNIRMRECINTDHRYWFTPYTLAKVLEMADIRMNFFYFTMGAVPRRNFIKRWLLNAFPTFQDTIIAVAKL